MGGRIALPKAAAIPALLAVGCAAYFLQPSELRRDPWLETQGVLGFARKYEVTYVGCADGKDKPGLDAAGLAKGLVGGYSHRFPAASDRDAAAFAAAARPQCDVASLYRLDRRLLGSAEGRRYSRVPVEF
jgi:hypothetical protein